MKALAEVNLMIQDEAYAATRERIFEEKHLELADDTIDRFFDGPACRRVAVVDFDPESGRPLPSPAAFVPFNTRTPTRGRYATSDRPASSPDFLAVTVFGTVFDTIRMFEAAGGLGRQVDWAFDGEQLLVVPRAGKWDNAYYDRGSRSLQFFWFQPAPGTTIYAALSRDIVAHECGHALLDAVVPTLYDALTPEGTAIHEAVADLVAVLMALRSKPLRRAVLAATGGSISDATAFSAVAEQFGAARGGPTEMPRQSLRDLRNTDTMETLAGARPHILSTVLSAIFYDTLIDMFETLKAMGTDSANRSPRNADHAANRALGTAAIVFRRLLLRAIDYLPPGELTFADVGRAALAADRAGDPEDRYAVGRAKLTQRFVDRAVVGAATKLDTPRPAELAIDPAMLPALRDSDWAAYRWVQDHCAALGIPPNAAFKLHPRVDATKELRRDVTQRELLLKVAWDHVEPNAQPSKVGGVPKRRIRTGTTLAWRWSDGEVLALVGSDAAAENYREARDHRIREMANEGLLTVSTIGRQPGDADSGAHARLIGDTAFISGTQRLLHLSAH